MPTVTGRRLRVNLDDPVVRRLARLIADEHDHPRLGTHDEMLSLRYQLLRAERHTWRVCARCDTPYDAADNPTVALCTRCMPV